MTRRSTSAAFGTRVLLLIALALGVAVVASPLVALGIDALLEASPETARSLGVREAGDGWDFGRVFRRLAMLSVLVCGFLLRRRLPRVRPRGIGGDERRAYFLLSGLAFGVLSFAAFLGGLVASGRLGFDPSPAVDWPGTLLEALLVGLLVGTIEEWAVRGWFQEGLAGRRGRAVAVVVTAAVYSILHYFRAGVPIDGAAWDVGLQALAAHGAAMVSPSVLAPALGLFLVGASLGYAYAWSRSLPFAIGVHAGWVAVIKAGELLFDRRLSLGWLWGAEGVLGTPWAWAWLAATIVAVRWWLRRPMRLRALFVAEGRG
jgi:membrane protease YdiL (CAAX protease family)